jgi:hypothetical protein
MGHSSRRVFVIPVPTIMARSRAGMGALITSESISITTESISITTGKIVFDVTPFIQSSPGQVVTLQLTDNASDGAQLQFDSREDGGPGPLLLLK